MGLEEFVKGISREAMEQWEVLTSYQESKRIG
jgi:hypothetical protein